MRVAPVSLIPTPPGNSNDYHAGAVMGDFDEGQVGSGYTAPIPSIPEDLKLGHAMHNSELHTSNTTLSPQLGSTCIDK